MYANLLASLNMALGIFPGCPAGPGLSGSECPYFSTGSPERWPYPQPETEREAGYLRSLSVYVLVYLPQFQQMRDCP